MAHDVFISYVSADRKAADATCAILEKNKIRCWVAPRDVLPGESWPKAIVDAISVSRLMVLILSANSNGSGQVMREVERAVHKGIHVLPLRIEDVVPAGDLEYFLGTTHWLDALPPPFEAHLERLARSVRMLLGPDEDPLPPDSAIVVLPFANMSPDADQDYFCEGMTEELISALGKIEGLRVTARTSAFFYQKRDVSVQKIRRELNVGMVIKGSVQKSRDRLRISVQLIETSTNSLLWAENYDREVGDVFAIQDEITACIVEKIKPRMGGSENVKISQRSRVHLEAYNLYLKGCYFRAKGTPGDLKKATAFFKQAIGVDGSYALPYAGIALSCSLLPFYSPAPPIKAIAKAKHLLDQALRLEPDLPEGYGCLGFIKTWYEKDWTEAEKAIQHAIELNPSSDRFYLWYAHHLMLRRRYEKALQAVNYAMELDPVAVVLHRDRGIIHYCAGSYDQAIEAFKETIAMDPHIMYAHSHLGAAYMDKAMYPEALAAFQMEKRIARGCHTWAETLEGLTYARMGQPVKTAEIREALLARSKQSYVSPFHLACLSFALHDDDQGFGQLEAANEAQDHWRCFLESIPDYDRVSRDSRMTAYLDAEQGGNS